RSLGSSRVLGYVFRRKTLGGVTLLFAGIGILTGTFDGGYLSALPNRLFGIMNNQTMLAVPLFVFMGVMLEKSRVRLLFSFDDADDAPR
ncbi:hypothetical protein ACQ4LH_22095, partial [Pseudomonas peli]